MRASLSKLLLKSQTDARLAQLAANDCEPAFDTIVDRYRLPLRRYCQTLLSQSLVDDVLQDTFIDAWSAINGGSEIRHLRAWLYQVAHNAAMRAVRKRGPEGFGLGEQVRSTEDVDEKAEQSAELEETVKNITALPKLQREALVKSAVEGQSREQIATNMGLSEGSVRQMLYRARIALRTAATAVVPYPLLIRLTTNQVRAPIAERIAELSAAAGSSGMLIAVKTGVTMVAVGAVAAVPLAIKTDRREPAVNSNLSLRSNPFGGSLASISFGSGTLFVRSVNLKHHDRGYDVLVSDESTSDDPDESNSPEIEEETVDSDEGTSDPDAGEESANDEPDTDEPIEATEDPEEDQPEDSPPGASEDEPSNQDEEATIGSESKPVSEP